MKNVTGGHDPETHEKPEENRAEAALSPHSEYEANAGKPLKQASSGGDMRQPKRYIDAGEVARILGVPRSVVVDDVRRGFTDAFCLNGEISGGICVVEVNDLDEPRWSSIKARLAPTVIKSAVQS